MEAIDLVKQDYGMVLLDNAERKYFLKPAKIPAHWLVVSFGKEFGPTQRDDRTL